MFPQKIIMLRVTQTMTRNHSSYEMPFVQLLSLTSRKLAFLRRFKYRLWESKTCEFEVNSSSMNFIQSIHCLHNQNTWMFKKETTAYLSTIILSLCAKHEMEILQSIIKDTVIRLRKMGCMWQKARVLLLRNSSFVGSLK